MFKTPRGVQDVLPADISKWQTIEEKILKLCKLYDYKEIRIPVFEYTNVFKRENDTSDMVNKEMYTFTTGSDSYTLRPEGTAGVIRSFVENKLYVNDLPVKLFYMGEMFRHEKPQKGRYRQFNQFGIENIGVKNPIVDAEVIALGYNILKEIGIRDISVKINTLGDKESRDNYRKVLLDYFKDKLDDLCFDCQNRYEKNPLRILDCKIDADKESIKNAPIMMDSLNKESKDYFDSVLRALEALDIPYVIDEKLVRGLDYYTHTVFEVISNSKEMAQSTIFGGGRYDGLVKYFNGPDMSGVGFAIGLERLLLISEMENIDLSKKDELDVYIINLSVNDFYGLKVASKVRELGYSCELNFVDRSMKSQFKSSDRYNSKAIIIIGEDEIKEDKINIKSNKTKEQVRIELNDLKEKLEKIIEG